MKNNRVYMPKDALARHEDFEIWYPDGELAITVKGPWEKESDKVLLFGRMGGEMGHVKPDHDTLAYEVRVETYNYTLHTIRIFKHYEVEGMLWQIDGSLTKTPFDFRKEESTGNEVHIRSTPFMNRGDCFEIKVKELPKLRIAAAIVVAIAIKEEYKGKSEGVLDPDRNALKKTKDFFFPSHGIPYEELLQREAEGREYV